MHQADRVCVGEIGRTLIQFVGFWPAAYAGRWAAYGGRSVRPRARRRFTIRAFWVASALSPRFGRDTAVVATGVPSRGHSHSSTCSNDCTAGNAPPTHRSLGGVGFAPSIRNSLRSQPAVCCALPIGGRSAPPPALLPRFVHDAELEAIGVPERGHSRLATSSSIWKRWQRPAHTPLSWRAPQSRSVSSKPQPVAIGHRRGSCLRGGKQHTPRQVTIFGRYVR
jgi:hypothetical protein